MNSKNYKSIEDSGNIQLHSQINILAGKNNTGKSAFIEILYKIINGSKKDGSYQIGPNTSIVLVEIYVSADELATLYDGVQNEYRVESLERFRLTFYYNNGQNHSYIYEVEMYYDGKYKSFYKGDLNNGSKYVITTLTGGSTFSGRIPTFINNMYSLLRSKVVYISGSRFVPESEASTLNNSLSIDGTNLNTFLYTLHNNEEKIFDKIKKTFTQIFTDVISVSTPIDAANHTHISIHFDGMDYPVPLSNCGSGYTHVLLLLCVLYTKKDSVVLFDEPQVFLHPSAEKAIYDLVNDNGEHQYIFTTHSPILINYPVEKHLFHVRKTGGKSLFTQLDQMQDILSDIGVNNSDYALSDKVIFVEGETEELVIPAILTHFGLKQIGYNYRILNMKGTGKEFSKRTAMNNHKGKLDLILGGVSQSPIPYKIIIDADDKTDEKIQEIKEQYSDKIIVLDRREYENYFLDCFEELAEIINNDFEEEIDITPDEIQTNIELIMSDTSDKKLYPRSSINKLKEVVGSEVLERLFEKYSLTYNKVKHGLLLTNLVLQNTPEKLEFFSNELQDFIMG